MKTIYKQENYGMVDRINAEIDPEFHDITFYLSKVKNDYEKPDLSNAVFFDYKDAADFCIEILQELFKDADFKRETLRRHGVKSEPVTVWEERPDEEIKVGDWVKTIRDNSYSNVGGIDKVTNINVYPDGGAFICISYNKNGMKHPAVGTGSNFYIKVVPVKK